MADGFYPYDHDDNESYKKTVALCVAAASLVVLLFLVFLYLNNEKQKAGQEVVTGSETEEEQDFISEARNFTSDELDFWKDAKKKENSTDDNEDLGEYTDFKTGQTYSSDKENVSENPTDTDNSTNSESSENSDSSDDSKNDEYNESEGEGSLNKSDDDAKEADDENHIAITDEKGNKKYYEILPELDKNDYDFDNNLQNHNGVIEYSDNKYHSLKGIDLSKYNGTIDWAKVKASGIDFAMLRLGSRGYSAGAISLDEKFVEYAQNATLHNIPIGAYFYSQAVTEAEAIEEANYIVGAIGAFGVKYPVAIDIEKVLNDDARTDRLTVEERTAIVKSFCSTVSGYGYKPIIYAQKNMLIAGLDLEELSSYDIWLADEELPTNFPYKFSLWQYSTKGRVDGIEGEVDLDISFVDYEKR